MQFLVACNNIVGFNVWWRVCSAHIITKHSLTTRYLCVMITREHIKQYNWNVSLFFVLFYILLEMLFDYWVILLSKIIKCEIIVNKNQQIANYEYVCIQLPSAYAIKMSNLRRFMVLKCAIKYMRKNL